MALFSQVSHLKNPSPSLSEELRDSTDPRSSLNIWEAHITSAAARRNENKALKSGLIPALLKSCLQDSKKMSNVLTDERGELWSHAATSTTQADNEEDTVG